MSSFSLHDALPIWRRACFRLVLVAVPWTGDAAKNNFAFAERAVLVLADVRDSGDFPIVFENRHAFTGEADDARTVFGNIRYSAGVNELVLRSGRGNEARTIPGSRMSLLTSGATIIFTIRSNFPSRRRDVQA